MKSIEKAGYKPGEDVCLGLDCAATEYFKGGKYVMEGEGKTLSSGRERRASSRTSPSAIPLISIEDGMAEDDWDGWKALTDALGKTVQLVGDDLFVTNTERLRSGIKMGVANSILVKVNQIGTLSRDARRGRYRAPRRLHLGDVAPLGRDRGLDDRRPRGGLQLRADQDRLAVALATAWRSTTSCSASRSSSAASATYAGKSILKATRARARARRRESASVGLMPEHLRFAGQSRRAPARRCSSSIVRGVAAAGGRLDARQRVGVAR